jgi:hypothetical protein
MDITDIDDQIKDNCLRESYTNVGADLTSLILDEDIENVVDQLPIMARHSAITAAASSFQLARTQLRNFIVDDQGMMIHVCDCITDAQKDGILKHTNKLPRDNKYHLNTINLSRVIWHSKQAKAYYDAVMADWNARRNSYSIGGHLNRLSHALRETGVKGLGSEMNVADGLVNGVFEFYQFTKKLNRDELELIFNLNSELGLFKRFKFYWFLILQGFHYILIDNDLKEVNTYLENLKRLYLSSNNEIYTFNNPTSETPCINFIADAIDGMLAANLNLFHKVPEYYKGLETVSLLETERNIEIQSSQFKTAMTLNELNHFDLIDVRGLAVAQTAIFVTDTPQLKKLCIDVVKDAAALARLLTMIHHTLQPVMLNRYFERIIKTLTPNSARLHLLFNENRDERAQYALLQTFTRNQLNSHLRKITPSFAEIAGFLRTAATPDIQARMLKALAKKHIKYYVDMAEYLIVLKSILAPAVYQKWINNLIGQAQITRLHRAATHVDSGRQVMNSPVASTIVARLSASGGNPLLFQHKRRMEARPVDDDVAQSAKRRLLN